MSYLYCIAVLSLVITLVIFSHAEIAKDKYGIISREKVNVLDYILIVLFFAFFSVVYLESRRLLLIQKMALNII